MNIGTFNSITLNGYPNTGPRSLLYGVDMRLAVTVGSGREYIVKDSAGTASTNAISIITAGGNVDGVAGGTGKTISTNYGSLRFVSDGTNWFTF